MKAAPVDLDHGRADRRAVPHRHATAGDTRGDGAGRQGARRRTSAGRASIGAAMPTVVRHGVVYSAANIDESWIGTDADALFTSASGCDVAVLNDADAAGVAEMTFGAGARSNRRRDRAHVRHRDRIRRVRRRPTWCRTPSSATSRSTDSMPKRAPPRVLASATTCRGSNGPPASTAISSRWSSCSRPS